MWATRFRHRHERDHAWSRCRPEMVCSRTPFVQPKPAWTGYSPPRPPESTSRMENFSNICHTSASGHPAGQKTSGPHKRRTFPVLPTLLLRLSAWSERRGSTPGIEPPVAYLAPFPKLSKPSPYTYGLYVRHKKGAA